MVQKIALLLCATTLGVMCYAATMISVLRDNVSRLLYDEMTVTKEANWYCGTHGDWETLTVSGEDATKVCEEFRTLKASEQKDHPPGVPPAGFEQPLKGK